jgi:sulfatase maturation enzyme AslB (radical SAM superfamily)
MVTPPIGPPDLRAMKLVLTAGCNLRCSYCYQDDKKDRRLDWEIARSALDLLLGSRRSQVELLFIGGEPLLEFPLIERAVEYLTVRRRKDQAIRLAVITNGTLLGEREAAFFVTHDFHLQLSFDGVAGAQAERGAHTFARLDALLDRLRDDHPAFFDQQLAVNITLLPRTLPWLAESVDYFVMRKGLQELYITPSVEASADWRPERIGELEAAFRGVYRACLRRYRETGEVPLQVFQKTGARSAPPGEIALCGVGRGDQIAIDVDGQAHGCLMFVESYQTFRTTFLRSRIEAMRLGDFRAPEFEERRRAYPGAVKIAEIFHHKEQKYSSYGRCGECRYLADCQVCPMSIGRLPGHDDPRRIPDFACAYNLISLKYRDKFPRLRSLEERFAGPARRRQPLGLPPARRRRSSRRRPEA